MQLFCTKLFLADIFKSVLLSKKKIAQDSEVYEI